MWARYAAHSTGFLQMVERDHSDSLVVAATNHVRILGPRLFRRFDDLIEYDLTDKARIDETLKVKLGPCPPGTRMGLVPPAFSPKTMAPRAAVLLGRFCAKFLVCTGPLTAISLA
jgi:hypothetical protein